MRFKKTISFLVICIILLSLFASLIGMFSKGSSGKHEFESIYGETVKLSAKGIYKYDSVSVAAQGKAQDIVTVLLGIPLLLYSLYLSRKGLLKGKLLLTGTLGYFLYTYVSYVFLWMYNPLFLVYVILMSTSFFSFTLIMMSFDLQNLNIYFSEKFPVKFIGGFQIVFAIVIGTLWLGRIIPPLIAGNAPPGLEHYTTLVIQGIDLGFLVPIAFLSGVLMLKRKPLGYLLSSIIIMKGVTMAAAITAMIIAMVYAGVQISIVEIVIFPLINLVIAYCLILILKNVNEK